MRASFVTLTSIICISAASNSSVGKHGLGSEAPSAFMILSGITAAEEFCLTIENGPMFPLGLVWVHFLALHCPRKLPTHVMIDVGFSIAFPSRDMSLNERGGSIRNSESHASRATRCVRIERSSRVTGCMPSASVASAYDWCTCDLCMECLFAKAILVRTVQVWCWKAARVLLPLAMAEIFSA